MFSGLDGAGKRSGRWSPRRSRCLAQRIGRRCLLDGGQVTLEGDAGHDGATALVTTVDGPLWVRRAVSEEPYGPIRKCEWA